MQLIECVPNFSEGRNRVVIDAIAAEIAGEGGVMLLDVDAGAATNRTVMTFIGPPQPVAEAAFRAIRKAAQLIDMARHHGEHPRMGATDVCPFVPVAGTTLEDCAEIARRVGRRVGEELNIPVYLYEAAATRPERKSLADLRQGEYEGLARKLQDREGAPDFGPARFDPRTGATVIGARPFLIAYNVNLNTRDKRLAQKIAMALREKGRARRDDAGEIVRDARGNSLWEPGLFTELRGVGWYIEEYGRAQVSFNLTDYRVTPVHVVFDACCRQAEGLGLRVTGSELVGLIPREALLAAGDHYLLRQGRTPGAPEAERVHAAVVSLGLSELAPFDPAAKVIEYRYRALGGARLVERRVTDFLDELSSDSPAPGGGSVAALCGSLSAALSSMVAALTWSKKGMEEERPAMRALGDRAQALKDWFVAAIDLDTDAFDAVLAARRRPKSNDEEERTRREAMEEANRRATQVPLDVLENAVRALELALAAAERGNPASVSDAGVAGACALAAAEGASLNVRINLPSIGDSQVAARFRDRQQELLGQARSLAGTVGDAVERALTTPS